MWGVFFLKAGRWTLHDTGSLGYCDSEAQYLRTALGLRVRIFRKL